ncbi:MAG TPA: ricin-type beta-trefoil lectin domain protein [Streptosporangiaceae bacterium]|nr:ricin-type beta-trefoil lectin domain protein [Streptosporangiaceae bacterium]
MILRRIVTLLSAGAFAVGLSTTLAGTARADVPPSPDWNEIVSQWDHNFNNTLCLDDPGGSHTQGTQLQLWHCHGSGSTGDPQRWHFADSGWRGTDGTKGYLIELNSTRSGTPLCITFPVGDINSGVIPPNERLVLGSCNTLYAVWFMNTAPGSNPLITLEDFGGNNCMATADFTDNNGTPLIVKNCSDTSDLSQVWFLA